MKKILAIALSLTLICLGFAFDWPQKDVNKNSYSSYFGQNRGDIISTALVFSEKSEIKAAESGHILIVMNEESDDSDFFPTTLGASIIISHEDNLLSVYGNIDPETMIKVSADNHDIEAETVIGFSGNSGWNKGNGHLEFQIIDTSNNTAINPKILMPRSEIELPLIISGVTLQGKNGKYHDISTTKSFESGLYRIYAKRTDIASPYRTSVAINGVTVDQITYDTISQENGRACVTGKKKYTSDVVYPTSDLQLLGEANLTPGKATLSLYSSDILGKTRQANFNINIY